MIFTYIHLSSYINHVHLAIYTASCFASSFQAAYLDSYKEVDILKLFKNKQHNGGREDEAKDCDEGSYEMQEMSDKGSQSCCWQRWCRLCWVRRRGFR